MSSSKKSSLKKNTKKNNENKTAKRLSAIGPNITNLHAFIDQKNEKFFYIEYKINHYFHEAECSTFNNNENNF